MYLQNNPVTHNPVKAKNLKLRSELMIAIKQKIQADNLTQTKAAEILNITLPRVGALLKGEIDDFRLDILVNLAHRVNISRQSREL